MNFVVVVAVAVAVNSVCTVYTCTVVKTACVYCMYCVHSNTVYYSSIYNTLTQPYRTPLVGVSLPSMHVPFFFLHVGRVCSVLSCFSIPLPIITPSLHYLHSTIQYTLTYPHTHTPTYPSKKSDKISRPFFLGCAPTQNSPQPQTSHPPTHILDFLTAFLP